MIATPVYSLPQSSPSGAPWPALIDGLTDALKSEKRLLEDLTTAMVRQREAVAADDLAAIDDSVFAVQRILLTLGEARKRRRTLNARLGQPEDLPIKEILERLAPIVTDALRRARDDLQLAAERLARDVATNRQLLREALSSSEEMVRTLAGIGGPRVGYGEERGAPAPLSHASYLVNRKA